MTKSLQHVFDESDVAEIDRLVQGHLDAFEQVPEYAFLDRPKHHFMKHLARALRNFGPFRQYWCMPFEAFIQLVKKILLMGNWTSAGDQERGGGDRRRGAHAGGGEHTRAYARAPRLTSTSACSCVCATAHEAMSFWSMKTALRLTEAKRGGGRREDYYGDEVMPSSPIYVDVAAGMAASQLLQMAVELDPLLRDTYAYRSLRSFTRGFMEFRSGDWIIACEGGQYMVGRLTHATQIFVEGGSFLRALLVRAYRIDFVDDTRGQVISVDQEKSPAAEHYLRVEDAKMHEVVCDERGSVLTFNYIY